MVKVSITGLMLLYFLPFLLVFDTKYAVEYIQLSSLFLVFLLPFIFFNLNGFSIPKDYSHIILKNNFRLNFFFLIFFLISLPLLTETISFIAQGRLFEFMLQNALDRYAGTDTSSIDQLRTVSFFIVSCYLGISKPKKIHLILYLLCIFTMSLSLSRAGVLLGLLMLGTIFCISRSHFFQSVSYFKISRITFTVAAVLFIVFYFSAYLRVYDSDQPHLIAISRLESYSLAMYDAFLIWMKQNNEYFDNFMINHVPYLYKMFDFTFLQGRYEPVVTEFGSTNIYTTLRNTLESFGFLGTSLITLLSSIFINYATYFRFNYFGIIVVHIFLLSLFFPFYSPFYFTSFTVAFLVFHLTRMDLK